MKRALLLILVVLALCAAKPSNTTLTIESIGLNEHVVPMSWQEVVISGTLVRRPVTPDNEVGWYSRTHVPTENNNTVLFGHSNIYNQVFKDLHLVQVGDEITLEWEGTDHLYVVTHSLVIYDDVPVRQKILNAELAMGDTDYKRLTLITCYGKESRLIIFAKGIK